MDKGGDQGSQEELSFLCLMEGRWLRWGQTPLDFSSEPTQMQNDCICWRCCCYQKRRLVLRLLFIIPLLNTDLSFPIFCSTSFLKLKETNEFLFLRFLITFSVADLFKDPQIFSNIRYAVIFTFLWKSLTGPTPLYTGCFPGGCKVADISVPSPPSRVLPPPPFFYFFFFVCFRF